MKQPTSRVVSDSSSLRPDLSARLKPPTHSGLMPTQFQALYLIGCLKSPFALVCHSELYLACPVLDTGESSISELDFRLHGNDGVRNNVKKCWKHYTNDGAGQAPKTK